MDTLDKKSDIAELYDKVDEYSHRKPKMQWKLPFAALMLVISGIFGILFSTYSLIPGYLLINSIGLPYIIIGCLHLFLGVTSLAGGVLAILKRRFKLALALSFPSLFILVLPGLIAIILLIYSDDEFKS